MLHGTRLAAIGSSVSCGKCTHVIRHCYRWTAVFTTISTPGALPRLGFNSPAPIPATPSSSVNQDV